MSESPRNEGRALAEIRLHRRLAAAHDSHANELAALIETEEEIELPQLRGSIQRRIVALPQLFTERGLSAAEIAAHLNYDSANAHSALNSLTDLGTIELVGGSAPKRWRMPRSHRRDRILRLSRLMPANRWATYGDFAVAVYDDPRMARTVARVAAKNPSFIGPHRILASGGVISEGWEDSEGHGAERCEWLLRDAGIKFSNGRADPTQQVGWESLRELLDEDEQAGELAAAA
ncbi:MAG TPA: MGMT family protein [Solirubrobacterales bacterium]|nr:MGMT family protein [Solirubrobacterales bacterium]